MKRRLLALFGAVEDRIWRASIALEMRREPGGDDYVRRVRAIHRRLGLPADYAHRGLVLQREASSLIPVPCGRAGALRLMTHEARTGLLAMQEAAAQAGVTLQVKWAFRSVDDQARLIRRYLRWGKGIEDILCAIAAPGYSEHHTGRAIDFERIPEHAAFEDTPAFAWMCGNAERFGFRLSYPRGNPQGIGFEPWHWCLRDPGEPISSGMAQRGDRVAPPGGRPEPAGSVLG